jgi:2-keto-4-pentenoate hydratase
MNAIPYANLVRELAQTRRNQGVATIDVLEGLNNFEDAYRLQDDVQAELGAAVAGWKLALPPGSEVISAPILDLSCLAPGYQLDEAALLRDGVECELAFRIDRDLPPGECTRDDVVSAVGAVMPAFELLCSRLPGKFSSPREHIVADGMGNGAVVLGQPCLAWRSLDLNSLQVTLWANDRLVVEKQGCNPFGDPLQAVVLLANHLARRGRGLKAGTFVLAGSHSGVYLAQSGEELRCEFSGVGQVVLNLIKTTSTTSEEYDHAGR